MDKDSQKRIHPIVRALAFLISLPIGGFGIYLFIRGILVSLTHPIYYTLLLPLTFLWDFNFALALLLGYAPAFGLMAFARWLIAISGIWPLKERPYWEK
ncbi:MAG: hypothetical protein WD751_05650 [Anaerolineales bacterium]